MLSISPFSMASSRAQGPQESSFTTRVPTRSLRLVTSRSYQAAKNST